jgi:hypothetical protein
MIIILALILLSLLFTNFWLMAIFGWLYTIDKKRKVERLYE